MIIDRQPLMASCSGEFEYNMAVAQPLITNG